MPREGAGELVGVFSNACPGAQRRPIVEENPHAPPMLTFRLVSDSKSFVVNKLTVFFKLC